MGLMVILNLKMKLRIFLWPALAHTRDRSWTLREQAKNICHTKGNMVMPKETNYNGRLAKLETLIRFLILG